MSNFRPWAFWRRLQYGGGFFGFWALLALAVYFVYFAVPPTCFDGVKNGSELAIDCGGDCVRICPFEVTPPRIVWAESFEIAAGQYNVVAYVENLNREAGTPQLDYTFKLFDQGTLIAERSGRTYLPPDGLHPIFEGRVFTSDGRAPTETVIELKPSELWLPATVARGQFRVVNHELLGIDSQPRFNVRVENTALEQANNVEVVATIFDRSGRPLTASQTFIDSFIGRTERDIVFTWPNSIAKSVRSCEVPSDIMIILDRSGSMAADGGNPPEPLESAKLAALQFLDLLRPADQVGFVSYATTPSQPIEQTLTNDFARVREAVMGVRMGTDGVQYTNTGEAFRVAAAELASERKRADARKVIVFMTDGDITRPLNPATGQSDREYAANYARAAALAAREANATIYTIGFGDFFTVMDSAVERDLKLIRDLASGPEFYFEAPTVADLSRVYSEIATGICEEGPTRFDVLPKAPTTFAPLR